MHQVKVRNILYVIIMWDMYTGRELNEIVNDQTSRRKEYDSPKKWLSKLKKIERKRLNKRALNAHICIIIGVNPKTEEVAFTDSWGERYNIRWMTLKHLRDVSQSSSNYSIIFK